MGNNLKKQYSVYITINLVNYKIYIGQHDESKPGIYLGCGVYANKPSSYMHPKFPFLHAVKKYGPKKFRRVIIALFDSLEDALKLERILVNKEFLKLPDVYNVALGGGRGPDMKKEVHKYSLFGEYLQSFNSLDDAARSVNGHGCSIGEAARNKHSSFGFLWSYEYKEKLNSKDYTIISGDTKIYIYDKSGKIEDVAYSIKLVGEYLNCPATSISKALKTGNSVRSHYVSYIEKDVYEIPEKFLVKGQKVYLYDLNGNFLKEWKNSTEVLKFFKLKSPSNLITALKTGRCFQNFQWRLEKFDSIAPYKKTGKTAPRRVGKFTKDDILVEEFDTISEARKKYGQGIIRCLRGHIKYHKDYCYKYLS